MFLKQTKSRGHKYLRIMESYRDEGRPKHRIVASLGRLDQLANTDQLWRLGEALIRLSNKKTQKDDVSKLKTKARINWGAVAVYRSLWNTFEMDDILRRSLRFSRAQLDVSECVFKMALNRVMEPSSKLKVYERQSKFLNQSEVSLHHLYRCLDLLAEGKEEIEKELFSKNVSLFNLSVDVVFYDVTTLYFESIQWDDLKTFGYSKDAKFNEVQVIMGLLIDAEGRPIGFDIFPGNTFEGHTLAQALEKLKQRFCIRNVIIVADQGINTKLNLKSIKDMGFDYIVGSRIKIMPQSIQAQVLDVMSYICIPSHTETIQYKILPYENTIRYLNSKHRWKSETLSERLICTWSSKRAQKNAQDRDRLVKKAMTLLETPGVIKSKRGVQKYIQMKTTEPTLNLKRIEEDAKWDGFYGIQCSKKDLSVQDVLNAYTQLWRIEEAFRVLKTTLQARPIFHWTPHRIKGHLMLCFIAFLLERTLEIKLKEQNISYSVDRIRAALKELEVSEVELESQLFFLTDPIQGLSKDILKLTGIKIPKSITPKSEFKVL